MKTNEHKEDRLARKCSANDLFLVREGLQCGNCLVLVEDDRPESPHTPRPWKLKSLAETAQK